MMKLQHNSLSFLKKLCFQWKINFRNVLLCESFKFLIRKTFSKFSYSTTFLATDQYKTKFQNKIKFGSYLPTLIFLAMSPETEHLFFLALPSKRMIEDCYLIRSSKIKMQEFFLPNQWQRLLTTTSKLQFRVSFFSLLRIHLIQNCFSSSYWFHLYT